MGIKPLAAAAAFLFGNCIYTETPYGRMAVVDLPIHSETTINKDITINAPPNITVIYQDNVPVGYPRPYPYRHYGYRFQTTFTMRTRIHFQSLFQS